MSKASRRTGAGPADRAERWQPRTAAVLTVLVHLLLVLLVMLAPPITMTPPPEGGDAGSSMAVTFIDESLRPPPPVRKPSVHPAPPRKPAKAAPAAKRIRTTLVTQAPDPVPPDAADSPTTSPAVEPEQALNEPPAAPAEVPEEPVTRPNQKWGQPPGMLPDAIAPSNAGRSRSPATNQGRSNASSSSTSMEVDGYQVYYDLVSETRLRAWRDQGMTELFLPLPGTRRLMVCPLEIALRRDSGACRMVEPDAPELKTIGDARDVINMDQVYKLGERVWSGPGPYR